MIQIDASETGEQMQQWSFPPSFPPAQHTSTASVCFFATANCTCDGSVLSFGLRAALLLGCVTHEGVRILSSPPPDQAFVLMERARSRATAGKL